MEEYSNKKQGVKVWRRNKTQIVEDFNTTD
jgi:hypothetical protein